MLLTYLLLGTCHGIKYFSKIVEIRAVNSRKKVMALLTEINN